jgi:hypothetical protein
MSANKFKPFDINNLNPVITKKQENKEIKLLRQSFSKVSMNSTLTNFKRFKSNDKSFGHFNSNKFTNNNNWHEMGNVFKNGFSEPKMEEFFVSNVSINHSVKEDSKKRIRIKIKKKYKEEVKKSEN